MVHSSCMKRRTKSVLGLTVGMNRCLRHEIKTMKLMNSITYISYHLHVYILAITTFDIEYSYLASYCFHQRPPSASFGLRDPTHSIESINNPSSPFVFVVFLGAWRGFVASWLRIFESSNLRILLHTAVDSTYKSRHEKHFGRLSCHSGLGPFGSQATN